MTTPAPTNGLSRIDLSDVPDALVDLTHEVRDLKTEVKNGFEALNAKDEEHDRKLAALAATIARKVTIPVAGLTIALEALRVLAAYLGGH